MANKAAGTIVSMGMTFTVQEVEDALCEAFRQAVDQWCPAGKGSFNSRLFDNLKRNNPDLAKRIAREVPVVFGGAAGKAGQTASSLVRSGVGGRTGEVAGWLHHTYTRMSRIFTGGASAWLSGANRAAGAGVFSSFVLGRGRALATQSLDLLKRAAPNCWFRFPDGIMPPRQVIEIKGPGDRFDPRSGQQRDYKRFSEPEAPIEPSCEQCNASCVSGPLAKGDNGCR